MIFNLNFFSSGYESVEKKKVEVEVEVEVLKKKY